MAMEFRNIEEGAPCSGFKMVMPDGDGVEVALYPQEYSRDEADHLSIFAFNDNDAYPTLNSKGIELQTREEQVEFYHKLGKLLGME